MLGTMSDSCGFDAVSFNLPRVQEREVPVAIDFSGILYYPEVKTLYLSLIEWSLYS